MKSWTTEWRPPALGSMRDEPPSLLHLIGKQHKGVENEWRMDKECMSVMTMRLKTNGFIFGTV